jgi:radical SAM enzyme (TIGR01210 family)
MKGVTMISRIKINKTLFIIIFCVIILLLIVGIETKLFTTYNGIIIAIISGFAIEIIAQYISHFIQEKSEHSKKMPEPTINYNINKFSTKYSKLESHLTQSRKDEIVQQLIKAYPHFVELRRKHLETTQKDLKKRLEKSRSDYLENAAWSSISKTYSPKGYRFVMGFKNRGCEYWQTESFNIGCFNCGYCSAILPDIKPTQKELELQFEKAIGEALDKRIDFDVVEFLNDGSFFNDNEFPPEFRKYLFKKLNVFPYIERILVETRPNYIKRETVYPILSELSEEKELEIGIGLETADEFIRTACINKGYNLIEFEDSLQCLSEFSDRVTAVVYALVKPAFLKEKEAIDDIVKTSQYLEDMQEKFKVNIVLKLEPAVVAQGTLLDVLYFGDFKDIDLKYKLISYWSIVEILCQLYEKKSKISIRIGAREDMDIIEKVPAVYDANGMFNKWDFIIYDAVQNYNIHHSISQLLSDLDEPMTSDNSFNLWKRENNFDNTAIERILKASEIEIEKNKSTTFYKERRNFLLMLFDGLNIIEYGAESISFAKKLYKHKKSIHSEEMKQKISKFIRKQFRKKMTNFSVNVLEANFEKDNLRLLRIFLEVRDLRQRESVYSIWAGIPTKEINNN